MGRVIVTGANGFLGKNLVNELTNAGIQVTALDICFSKEIMENKSVECINVQKLKISDIKSVLSKHRYDCFFHLAWEGTSGPARSNYKIQLKNVQMVCEYVELCHSLNCQRFIYASSINEMETYEYLQSDDIKPSGGYIYGTGKLAGHLMGEVVAYQKGIEFIPIIITNIYGAGEKSARLINTAIRQLLNKEHCSFTEGYQTYDFIYIDDAINAMIEIAVKGKAFNRYYIGSGHPKPLKDFLIEMRDVVDEHAELGLGDIPFNGIDISYDQFNLFKVKEDTDYENKISFKEGIRLTKEYIEGENQDDAKF
ncbi:NAD(P)-dependent oxidoreductase [Thomasclavelia sp.]|uniref:NAD-dependent epimerase/dehydratase family protein n=1 Tax=Thomasclavelia sp. TaxID=3025757 RepID=UPI0025F3ED8D|nr:NAD(P)-dependent oxidoreductase [Thomasclavelia sp.]